MAAGLQRVSESELVRLVGAIARADFAEPVTRAALVLAKFGHLEGELDALVGHTKAAATAIVAAVLRERRNAPARAAIGVWSGPPLTGSGTRAPYDTLLELIATAEHGLLLTGVDLERDARLLRSLHSAQRGRALQATVIVGPGRQHAAVAAQAHALFQERRPWPALYVPDAERVSAMPFALFADRKRALLLSGAAPAIEPEDCALTQGILVEDEAVANALWAQWQMLIETAAVLPLAAA